SVECFRRTDASAPPAESLPAPKFFFKNVFHTQRLPLFMCRTIFGQVFGRGGREQNRKMESPLPGGEAGRKKLLVSWGPLVIAAPLAGSLLAPLRCAGPCQSRARATWPPSRCPHP